MITAEKIRALRERTHAPITDCKKALIAVDGDMEKAVDELRKKGLAISAKRGDKEASQGLIGAYALGTSGVLVEVCSETDFVARNELFQEFVDDITKLAYDANIDSKDALMAASYKSGKVEDALASLVGSIRENIMIGRVQRITVAQGCVGSYVHDRVSKSAGRIAVLVALEGSSDVGDSLADFAKRMCMHIAASKPDFCFEDDIDTESLERERALAEEKARQSGKPDNIVAKIVEGRVRAYAEAAVFVKQPYLFDSGKTVAEAVKEQGVTLVGFCSLAIKGT